MAQRKTAAARKKGSGSGTNKKTAAKKAAPKKTRQVPEPKLATASERLGSDILGVVLLSLGVLLALYLYGAMPEAGLGRLLYWLLYNAVGMVAMALPPACIVLGILVIIGRKRSPASGRIATFLCLVLFTAALLHMACDVPWQKTSGGKTVNIPFVEYVLSCSERALGTDINVPRAGGVLGGLLCYILQLMGGKTLCAVVLIAGLCICLLLLTRISLKTFPELIKINIDQLFRVIDPDDEEDTDYDADGDGPESDDGYAEIAAAANAALYAPKKTAKPMTVFSLSDTPLQEGKETKLKGRRKKKETSFEDTFTVPGEEPEEELPEKSARDVPSVQSRRAPAPANKGEGELSFYPTGRVKHTAPAAPQTEDLFLAEEPIDDTLPMPEELVAYADRQAEPTLPVTHFVRPEEPADIPPEEEPRESAYFTSVSEAPVLTAPGGSGDIPAVEEEPAFRSVADLKRDDEQELVFLEDTKPFEIAPPAAEQGPKLYSMEELTAGCTGEAYTPAERAEYEAPKPDAPMVCPDEVTGEPLPVAQEAPEVPYEPFPLSCLKTPELTYSRAGDDPRQIGELLIETLRSFNIEATLLGYTVGPTVTRYELQPAPGVRVARITSLSNDIALALAATRVRIEAPIPKKAAVGIEVPNKTTASVLLQEVLDSKEFHVMTSPVSMALGKDIAGKIITADLAKMPHMLIAGSTGSGKSVCINDLILSMVFKSSPKELRLILVDPKQVELSVYAVLPHLLIPVVTEPKKASAALRWAVNEMTMRYRKFSEKNARDIMRFNELQPDETGRLPRIVVIIDELADLMMVAPDEVEDSICRIAQLGRAAGIHLIVATQRPSADVITGLIKANIPSRAAFAVSSAIDSRIILDQSGAEKLLGRGDCLFHPNGAATPTRLQAAFVSDEEVEHIMDHYRGSAPRFDEDIMSDVDGAGEGGKGGAKGEGKQEDDLLGEAVRVVLDSGSASISMIQRKLRVGYARAARLVDMMEEKGYVSGFDGSKPRKVLIKRAEFEAIFGGGSCIPESGVPEDIE